VISITDGQIFSRRPLLLGRPPGGQRRTSVVARRLVGADEGDEEGRRPAAPRLAQYRSLEAFAQFGSELDQATQSALNRGEKMVATLNQPQYQPWPMEEQAVAVRRRQRLPRRHPTEDVVRFQDEVRESLRAEGTVYKTIARAATSPRTSKRS